VRVIPLFRHTCDHERNSRWMGVKPLTREVGETWPAAMRLFKALICVSEFCQQEGWGGMGDEH
jgi:hypothetical protein